MNTFILISISFLLGFTAIAADPTPAPGDTPSTDNTVLARIGETDVRIDDIRSSIANLDPREQEALTRDPTLLNQLVRSLLTQRIVLNEALGKHWDQDPATAALLQRTRDNTIVQSYLQFVSQPPADYPSDAEIKSAYETNKASLLVPRQYHLAQIFVALAKGGEKAETDKAQAKLESIKKSLRPHEADFSAIARANSDEPRSAEHGGEIGWLPEAQIQPEIRPQVIAMAKNTVSEPIRLEDGWHILKLLEIKEPFTPSLEEVRTQLSQQLRAERAKANSQAYLAKLLQKTPVTINELALSKVLNKNQK